MIGAIIGDIAGSSYEFNNTSDYNFPLFSADQSYTDDTICTIAVADAIINGRSYQDAMRDWCRRYPEPMGDYGTYFLKWIKSPDPHPYNSFGNGSAMRVSPIAWLFADEASVRLQAEQSAAITHNHPEGIKGAVAIASAIFRMRTAAHKSSDIFEATATEFYGPEVFCHLPYKGVFDVTCQGCVPLSLHLCCRATSFEDAIRKAVIYGGDTDTVGAIVGSLAEAQFPIPEEMTMAAKCYLPVDMLRILSQFESNRL